MILMKIKKLKKMSIQRIAPLKDAYAHLDFLTYLSIDIHIVIRVINVLALFNQNKAYMHEHAINLKSQYIPTI